MKEFNRIEQLLLALRLIEETSWHTPDGEAYFEGDPEVFRLKSQRMWVIAAMALELDKIKLEKGIYKN